LAELKQRAGGGLTHHTAGGIPEPEVIEQSINLILESWDAIAQENVFLACDPFRSDDEFGKGKSHRASFETVLNVSYWLRICLARPF
jgi:hypothetical protein